jgi:hypothetical protein
MPLLSGPPLCEWRCTAHKCVPVRPPPWVLSRPGLGSVDLQLWHEDDDRVAVAVVADVVAGADTPQTADARLLQHHLELLGGSFEPLQAGPRSGLIAMAPIAPAETLPDARPAARAQRA